MNNRTIELLVGCFVLTGIGAILYLAIQIGGGQLFGKDTYELQAQFSSVAGVNPGSRVEIAGVRVGKVKHIKLNEFFAAEVTMELPAHIRLDEDTVASIKTAGLIGDRFIQLTPGGSDNILGHGDLIFDTESAMDIEGLISRFALGGIDDKEE